MSYVIQNGKLVKKIKGFKQITKMAVHSPDYTGTANLNTGKWKIPLHNGMAMFTAHEEASKMLQQVINDPSPNRVYTNDRDLLSLPFMNDTAGFFIAILPTQPHPTNPSQRGFMCDEDYSKEAAEIMNKFGSSKVALGDGLYMISSYATWDMAQKHYKDIHRVFAFAVIGFSTPKHLQILTEDPKHYLTKAKQYA
jgi:hypothetical protein